MILAAFAVVAIVTLPAYLVVLRRQTRRHRAATTGVDTRFVVSMTERVRGQL